MRKLSNISKDLWYKSYWNMMPTEEQIFNSRTLDSYLNELGMHGFSVHIDSLNPEESQYYHYVVSIMYNKLSGRMICKEFSVIKEKSLYEFVDEAVHIFTREYYETNQSVYIDNGLMWQDNDDKLMWQDNE